MFTNKFEALPVVVALYEEYLNLFCSIAHASLSSSRFRRVSYQHFC